jgi:hypothetical protein
MNEGDVATPMCCIRVSCATIYSPRHHPEPRTLNPEPLLSREISAGSDTSTGERIVVLYEPVPIPLAPRRKLASGPSGRPTRRRRVGNGRSWQDDQVPRASRFSVLVVLTRAAATAAAGCAPALSPLTPGGATPRPTTAAPLTATAALVLDGPIGSTGLFEPTAWLRACAVLDDAGLRTVLPQTGRIARDPVWRDHGLRGRSSVHCSGPRGVLRHRRGTARQGLRPRGRLQRVRAQQRGRAGLSQHRERGGTWPSVEFTDHGGARYTWWTGAGSVAPHTWK